MPTENDTIDTKETGETVESGADDSNLSENARSDDSEGRRKRKERKSVRKKKQVVEKINVDTNTQVQLDSKQKRNKLDEAVRKILLFKDMKASEFKGDLDSSIKHNQIFIKDTIQ